MSAAQDLVSNYQHVISSLTFTMAGNGVFDVTVDGELLYSKHVRGRYAEPGEVLELFTEAYAQGVTRYGD